MYSSRFLDGIERLSARGYFLPDSSHSEIVASARRVQIKMKCLTLLLYMLQFVSFSDCFKAFLKTY